MGLWFYSITYDCGTYPLHNLTQTIQSVIFAVGKAVYGMCLGSIWGGKICERYRININNFFYKWCNLVFWLLRLRFQVYWSGGIVLCELNMYVCHNWGQYTGQHYAEVHHIIEYVCMSQLGSIHRSAVCRGPPHNDSLKSGLAALHSSWIEALLISQFSKLSIWSLHTRDRMFYRERFAGSSYPPL